MSLASQERRERLRQAEKLLEGEYHAAGRGEAVRLEKAGKAEADEARELSSMSAQVSVLWCVPCAGAVLAPQSRVSRKSRPRGSEACKQGMETLIEKRGARLTKAQAYTVNQGEGEGERGGEVGGGGTAARTIMHFSRGCANLAALLSLC